MKVGTSLQTPWTLKNNRYNEKLYATNDNLDEMDQFFERQFCQNSRKTK